MSIPSMSGYKSSDPTADLQYHLRSNNETTEHYHETSQMASSQELPSRLAPQILRTSSARDPSSHYNSTVLKTLSKPVSRDEDFIKSEDFEAMVGELRRSFIGWLKRTEGELRREKENIRKRVQDVELMKEKAKKEIEDERKREMDEIDSHRSRVEQEVRNTAKQIIIEREEARKKINEDRSKFEHEKETQRQRITMEREKLRREYESFEAERQRVVDANIATQTLVSLNVGGVVFETARHTVTQQTGSFLELILSGRHQITRDREGRVFLDRDAELFRTLLAFLRNPSSPPIPRDALESEAICKEAEYYGLRFYPYPLVFACGGHNGSEHLNSMELLDVNQQCWRPCKSMETERCYFGSEVLGSRLYIFGGQNLDYKALADLEVYDTLRDVWMEGPPLTFPRRNTCALTDDNRIYTFGGFDGTSILSSVECYDRRSRAWLSLAPMPIARSSAMCALLDKGRIIILGGTKGERLRNADIYDIRMNKWLSFEADMLDIRSAGACVSILNEIFVLGGTDSHHNIHSSLESYDQSRQTWLYRKDMKTPRMDTSCVAVSDSIMVTGGQCGEVLRSCEFYRPELDKWHDGPPMTTPRYGHGLLLLNL